MTLTALQLENTNFVSDFDCKQFKSESGHHTNAANPDAALTTTMLYCTQSVASVQLLK